MAAIMATSNTHSGLFDVGRPKLTNLNPELPASHYERRGSVFSNITGSSFASSRSSGDLEPEKAAFCSSLQKFFNNGTFSDAAVHCQGQIFKVHSLVLSMHSEFFARAFNGPWKESSNGRHIDLEEVEVPVVEAMLHFMYHFEYTHPAGFYPLQFDAMVYSIADRYIIPQLKEYARKNFETGIRQNWGQSEEAFEMEADEKTEVEVPEDLPSVVFEVYETTPESDRTLRDLVVGICHRNNAIFSQDETFQATLSEVPSFAADLVVYGAQKGLEASTTTHWCLTCYEPREFQEAFCRNCHTSFGIEDVSGPFKQFRSGSIYC
ncbi:BTB/POZ protein [Xylariaceae sp. FL0255]|nr:BTB/POZ protein [Xylariaceae sp. FL0255]